MTMRDDVISEHEWTQLRAHWGLSRQQTEIMKGVFRGKPEGEIARELMILPHTVRTQIDHIYREFGLSNRLQLVLHVLASLREFSGRSDLFIS